MSDQFEEPDLSEVEWIFNDAVKLMRDGDTAGAKDQFKQVLRADPRLPEPYLELAIISREEQDLDLAIDETRMGLELLEKGGQWVDTLPNHVVLAHARNLLAELLVEAAQQGDIPIQPDVFEPMWNEAVALFESAQETDPDNETARANAVLYKRVAYSESSDEE